MAAVGRRGAEWSGDGSPAWAYAAARPATSGASRAMSWCGYTRRSSIDSEPAPVSGVYVSGCDATTRAACSTASWLRYSRRPSTCPSPPALVADALTASAQAVSGRARSWPPATPSVARTAANCTLTGGVPTKQPWNRERSGGSRGKPAKAGTGRPNATT
eukprot:7383210-Prymnesium_polylepis.1